MAKLEKIEFLDFGPCRVIGKAIRTAGMGEAVNPIPALWKRCFSDGSLERLFGMRAYLTDVRCPIGFMDEPGEQDLRYIVGLYMRPDTPVPEGYAFRDIPALRIARSTVCGQENEVYAEAHDKTIQAIEQNGGRIRYPDQYFSAEVYVSEPGDPEHFVLQYDMTIV